MIMIIIVSWVFCYALIYIGLLLLYCPIKMCDYLLKLIKFVVIMDENDIGYYDALKCVYEHTYGDNYKLSVKDKMQKLLKK